MKFRVAIADKRRKTAEIAATFNISISHCRELRRRYGAPWDQRLTHGYVSEGKWMQNATLLHDVKTMRCKEVVAKYDLAETSVIAMRRQVGVSKAQITRSQDFRHAVKTMLAKDVAAEFRLGISVVLKHRRKLGVNRKPPEFLNRLPAFIHDVTTIYSATEVARKWHCTDTYVHSVRRQIKRRGLI
jgi:hypothetical protein